MMRDLELKSEENLRNKRNADNWKRRQELKLKNNTEVLNVSKLPRKKAPKEPKKKTRATNIQGGKQVTSPTRIRWLENRHACSERRLGLLL